MIDNKKEILERFVTKISECIPEQLKQYKDEWSAQAKTVLEKALLGCHIITQSEFEKHLGLLERLQTRVEEMEQRLKNFEDQHKS